MRTVMLAMLFSVSVVCSAAEPQRPEPKRDAEVNLTPGAKARPRL
jgi:hypothetical protein